MECQRVDGLFITFLCSIALNDQLMETLHKHDESFFIFFFFVDVIFSKISMNSGMGIGQLMDALREWQDNALVFSVLSMEIRGCFEQPA